MVFSTSKAAHILTQQLRYLRSLKSELGPISDPIRQGENFDLGYGGRYYRGAIGGTSASSPTFAAVISQLNDYRLSKKLKPLGFLNPFIYSKGYKALVRFRLFRSAIMC